MLSKKLIPRRVRAALCLYRRKLQLEQLNNSRPGYGRRGREHLRMQQAITRFFNHTSPVTVRYYAMLVFKCWALNECADKAKLSDAEFAEHLDRMNDLISALHRYHQQMRVG